MNFFHVIFEKSFGLIRFRTDITDVTLISCFDLLLQMHKIFRGRGSNGSEVTPISVYNIMGCVVLLHETEACHL